MFLEEFIELSILCSLRYSCVSDSSPVWSVSPRLSHVLEARQADVVPEVNDVALQHGQGWSSHPENIHSKLRIVIPKQTL